MHYLAYLRVSTDEQSASGAGLDAQRDACSRYVMQRSAAIDGEFADHGVSGAAGLDKRPALLSAIASLSKSDVLLVTKRDRIGRDPIAVAMIESAVARQGARIVSVAGEGTEGDDPSCVLMRRMVDAFAEYERLIIKSRTKAALQSMKARGERVGHIPYGSRLSADDMHLEADPLEQSILLQIATLQQQGLPLRKIAQELNSRGALNRGAQWNHVAVSRVSKNTA